MDRGRTPGTLTQLTLGEAVQKIAQTLGRLDVQEVDEAVKQGVVRYHHEQAATAREANVTTPEVPELAGTAPMPAPRRELAPEDMVE
ncbi:MAG TPA: hypothetical protein VJG67_01830 [Candidatus Paceibacterota bacterium]